MKAHWRRLNVEIGMLHQTNASSTEKGRGIQTKIYQALCCKLLWGESLWKKDIEAGATVGPPVKRPQVSKRDL